MQNLPSDMSELLAVATVADGDIGDIGSTLQLLEACIPSILLLSTADGRVVFADEFREGAGLGMAKMLAVDLARELATKQVCSLKVLTGVESRWAFGVRLPQWAGSGVAGCVVQHPEGADLDLRHGEPALIGCAGFGWSASQHKARERELRTRVAHLRAEHETLKNAQEQAFADAIKEREKRLQRQQQDMAQLEAIMKLAADGIVTVNEEGIIQSFNQAAGRIFGYEPDEVIGQRLTMLMPQSSHQRHDEHLAKYINSDQASIAGLSREVMGRRKDGTVFPLEIATSKVPTNSGPILTGIFRDIANRIRMEGQLVQAQKMESVGQLAAGIAHEINTPTQYVGDNTRFLEDVFLDLVPLLACCNTLCQAVEKGGVPEHLVTSVAEAAKEADLDYLIDEIPKAIGQSLEGIDQVAKIVRSMKDFSHPSGEAKQAVDLNRALDSTLTVCRNEWKYVAEAVTDFDPDLPMVTCLPGECNQVFLNLLINAAHAIGDNLANQSAEKGTITVATRRDGNWAEVRIGDTGTGIPEESRSRIFDPFFTTKEVGRGTGQGLAIAHSVITEKHEGTIKFETEIGVGTTFIVRLPISGGSSSKKGAESEEADFVG